jgi:ubiquitin C-terminal hydrolase
MNATLQCLFATDTFNYYIKSKKFKYDLQQGNFNLEVKKHNNLLKLNPHITKKELEDFVHSKKQVLKDNFKNSLVYSLYQVYTTMWNSNCIVKPKKLKEVIGNFCPRFANFNQHDSEELLYALFDRINDELKTDIKINKYHVSNEVAEYYAQKKQLIKQIKSQDQDQDNKDFLITELNKLMAENYNSEITIKSIDFWKKYLENNNSIISTLFTGLFASEVKCLNCNNLNISFEPFNILEVPLTNQHKQVLTNLDQCIQRFCEPELVNEYNCERCKKKNGTAHKRLTIFKLPPKLIIQLKRFTKNQGRARGEKISDLIDFPLENLNFNSVQTSFRPIASTYSLYATVNHSGGVNGGHYVANCKNVIDKNWYHFNDSSVNYISNLSNIVDHSAYILFYEEN